ncbi:MAG: glutathione S-transferase family protein [Saprospiraceae bacterium]
MSYTVYYFSACKSFWGRAIGIVLTLEEAGVDYEVLMPEEAPSGRFTYPLIKLDTGETIGQVPAILNILGDRFSLSGKTENEKIICQQMVLDMDDIFTGAQSGHFLKNTERADQWFDLLNQRLAEHQFLVTDKPTVADFHAVFATEWVQKSYKVDAYDSFPHLARWWADICDYTVVRKMKASEIPMIP